MKPLRIGTRGSRLALWQAHYVRDLFLQHHPGRACEIITFSTQGDRMPTQALPEIGGRGVFTADIEQALLAGHIDIAVHSLKDLPTQLSAEFALAAILPRASAADALISRGGEALAELPAGAIIGTSSLRRAAQVKAYRPDLQIRPIRGNVETRLQKTLDPGGDYAGTLLAVAGLERLGLLSQITQILPLQVMLPAPAQGAIAAQARANDEEVLAQFAPLDHKPTRLCVESERAFLSHLGAGCSLPVSAYGVLVEDQLHLEGRVHNLEGSQSVQVRGQAPAEGGLALAASLAEQALAQGAAQLLAELGR